MDIKRVIHRCLTGVLILAFLVSDVRAYAQGVAQLPLPGSRLELSPAFTPPILKGIKVYCKDPFRFDFILDKGDATRTDDELKTESNRLIKYFLASLTIPEKDLWVNLSPYEKDRIVPEAFGQTEMGRDLLAQDYILKQITASVIYPEGEVGKQFWAKVYAKAREKYGTTDIPVDTFNKVWIVPQKATVYEHKDAAFVTESRLKVMLDEDYLALEKNSNDKSGVVNKFASDIVREVVIPVLEKEVNEGAHFATLRQVYHSHILAIWYKRKIKASIMGQAYVDKRKTGGIDIADMNEKEKIWSQYVEAFKKGAYNLIKEEVDPSTQQAIPRKYFSGGANLDAAEVFKIEKDPAAFTQKKVPVMGVFVRIDPVDPVDGIDPPGKGTAGLRAWLKAYKDGLKETAPELAMMFGVKESLISRMKKKEFPDLKIPRKGGERVKEVRKWAQGASEIEGTQASLAEGFNISPARLSQILKPYALQRKKKEKARWAVFMAWVGSVENAGGEKRVSETLAQLEERFGIDLTRISRVLGKKGIETAGDARDGTKRLRAWAQGWVKDHPGLRHSGTLQELADQYGLSVGWVFYVLKPYGIKTSQIHSRANGSGGPLKMSVDHSMSGQEDNAFHGKTEFREYVEGFGRWGGIPLGSAFTQSEINELQSVGFSERSIQSELNDDFRTNKEDKPISTELFQLYKNDIEQMITHRGSMGDRLLRIGLMGVGKGAFEFITVVRLFKEAFERVGARVDAPWQLEMVLFDTDRGTLASAYAQYEQNKSLFEDLPFNLMVRRVNEDFLDTASLAVFSARDGGRKMDYMFNRNTVYGHEAAQYAIAQKVLRDYARDHNGPQWRREGRYRLSELLSAYLVTKNIFLNFCRKGTRYITESSLNDTALMIPGARALTPDKRGSGFYEVEDPEKISQDGLLNFVKYVETHAKDEATVVTPGGIDLDPAEIDLKIKDSGEAINFDIDPAMLSRLQNAIGVVPVILGVHSLESIGRFMGID